MVLQITKEATMVVRALIQIPKSEIDRFIASKQEWINKHLTRMEKDQVQRNVFELGYGSKILLLGHNYTIRAGKGGLEQKLAREDWD